MRHPAMHEQSRGYNPWRKRPLYDVTGREAYLTFDRGIGQPMLAERGCSPCSFFPALLPCDTVFLNTAINITSPRRGNQ